MWSELGSSCWRRVVTIISGLIDFSRVGVVPVNGGGKQMSDNKEMTTVDSHPMDNPAESMGLVNEDGEYESPYDNDEDDSL